MACEHGVKLQLYIYADDIVEVLTHHCPIILQQAAAELKVITGEILQKLGLRLSVHKCLNLSMSPGSYVGDLFRRKMGLSDKAKYEAPKRDARLQRLAQLLQQEAVEEGLCPESIKSELPYEYSSSIKILGLVLDENLGFAEHTANVLKRAIARHGVMAQPASTGWGIEAGVLRSTHIALITSLIRYGFATYGGYMYEKCMDRLDTQVANIAARRVAGAHRSARLEILTPTAGLMSARNMFIQQCGEFVIRALEAIHSP